MITRSATDIEVWDSAAVPRGIFGSPNLLHEQLAGLNWEQGPAGTREVDWGVGVTPWSGYGPFVAESWKTPEIGTWVLQIRRGIRWALDPQNEASRLVGGREFTADDAVYSIRRYTTDPQFPNANVRRSLPLMARGTTAEKTGPWEVTVKVPQSEAINGFLWVITGGNSHHLFAPEVMKKYGPVNDWHIAVGTGPYMVRDLVEGSTVTLVKNPNYWGKDEAGPGKGNQLPYIDTVKILVVPDNSTRMAAMRTARADWVTDVEQEDARSLITGNAQLKYKSSIPLFGAGIHMKIGDQKLPFKDKKVRQALFMATDFESMKRDLYRGQAEILFYPVSPTMPWLYTPLDKQLEAIRKLYTYNPEEAKKLLAEAGYPNGFKTTMYVLNSAERMDPAAVFKAMWAKVGIDVELKPRELGAFQGISTARSWEEMIFGDAYGTSYTLTLGFTGMRGGTLEWKDQKVEDTLVEMNKYAIVNMPKVDEIYKGIYPYLLEQAYVIPRPQPFTYVMWQPWLKNTYGETNYYLFPKHAWIDQDMKEKVTGRR